MGPRSRLASEKVDYTTGIYWAVAYFNSLLKHAVIDDVTSRNIDASLQDHASCPESEYNDAMYPNRRGIPNARPQAANK